MNGRDNLVRGRRGAFAGIILGLAAAASGCIGARDASCDQLCNTAAAACGVDAEACRRDCAPARAAADHLACGAEYGAVTACATDHADLCNATVVDQLCHAETEAYQGCLNEACRADPTSPLCADICEHRCRAASATCGFDWSECSIVCGAQVAEGEAMGCGRETWDALACAFAGTAIGICDGGSCFLESEALRTCTGPEPEPSPTPAAGDAQYYEACDTRSCGEGSCVPLQTARTSGSLCTATCLTTADCPGRTATCVPLDNGAGICLPTCGGDYDCGAGTYCVFISYDVGERCVPDL